MELCLYGYFPTPEQEAEDKRRAREAQSTYLLSALSTAELDEDPDSIRLHFWEILGRMTRDENMTQEQRREIFLRFMEVYEEKVFEELY